MMAQYKSPLTYHPCIQMRNQQATNEKFNTKKNTYHQISKTDLFTANSSENDHKSNHEY